MPSVVENQHHHLWTDCLHARALARQARNEWDRGAYVRWTVTTAWTVIEIACQHALKDDDISYNFKKKLDRAIENGGHAQLDWGSGIWQEVRTLQELRKSYVHRFLKERDLFSESRVADDAIRVARNAVMEIYCHVGRPAPTWINEDQNEGWDAGRRGHAALTAVHAGASLEDKECIFIKRVRGDKESTAHVLPKGTDFMPYVKDTIAHTGVPISAIRVYQGEQIIHQQEVNMRGN